MLVTRSQRLPAGIYSYTEPQEAGLLIRKRITLKAINKFPGVLLRKF